jgi:hypothetical protein
MKSSRASVAANHTAAGVVAEGAAAVVARWFTCSFAFYSG